MTILRHRRRTTMTAFAAAAVCALVLAGCSDGSSSADDSGDGDAGISADPGSSSDADADADADPAGPIKLGVILELTGNASVYGIAARNAIEMALDEVDHQVAGRSIQVIYADDASKPDQAVAKARQLVEKDSVDATFGPVFSDAQNAIAPYLGRQGILAMAPIGADWSIHEYDNWVVYPGTLESFCEPAGAALAKAGARTMTTLGADYVAGHQFVDPPADGFEAAGGTVVQQQWVPLGTADFGSYMSAMKPADVFLAWTIMPDELSMMQAFLDFKGESGTDMFLCEADNVSGAQLAQVGSELVGTRGMIGAYSPTIDNSLNQAFVAEYQARYDKTPTLAAGSAYVTFQSLLHGLEASGGNTDLEVLRPAILQLDRDTIAGPVAFSSNGYGITNRYFAEVAESDGEFYWDVTETIEAVQDPRDDG